MLTSRPLLTSTFPQPDVLLPKYSFITESWSRGTSICGCMKYNTVYSCGGCQASEEPCCLLQGIYINHEAKTAGSSRRHKLCVRLYTVWYKPQACSYEIFKPHPVEEIICAIKPSSVNCVTKQIVHFLEGKTKSVLKFYASISEVVLNLSTKCRQFRNILQHAVAMWILIGGHYKSFCS